MPQCRQAECVAALYARSNLLSSEFASFSASFSRARSERTRAANSFASGGSLARTFSGPARRSSGDAQLPPDRDVHVIIDNYGTHKAPKVIRWFVRHPRYHLHFTPTSASWLNQVERFFSTITTRRIRRGTFESVLALEAAIHDYLAHYNEHCTPFVWTATADVILDKVSRFCQRTSGNTTLAPLGFWLARQRFPSEWPGSDLFSASDRAARLQHQFSIRHCHCCPVRQR